jgi:hypothetical protein
MMDRNGEGFIRCFALAKLFVKFAYETGGRRDLVEFLSVGAIGSFHGAVEFRTSGRKKEQVNALLSTGVFELGVKLGAAIDLNGADWEGHPVCVSA